MHTQINKQTGFTLVELVMVLLIVSILIAGVIKASEFISNTKVKRLHKDLVAFKTATYGFYNKMGRYPGGNGSNSRMQFDSVLDTSDGSFFQDLYDEGFIKSPAPTSVFGSSSYYFANYLSSDEALSNEAGAIPGSNQVCVTNLHNSYVQSIESAFDDFKWNAGNFRSVDSFDASETHTFCINL